MATISSKVIFVTTSPRTKKKLNMKMKRYNIELSEDQMLLIAQCMEDISRFAAGQLEMEHTLDYILMEDKTIKTSTDFINKRNKIRKILNLLKEHIPGGKSYNSNSFIGNTYHIYREIYHRLSVDKNYRDVYSTPTLESGDMGTIKIKESTVNYQDSLKSNCSQQELPEK